MGTWALQDANNRLSELVRQALGEGAQEITLRGEPAVTVIATRNFNDCAGSSSIWQTFRARRPRASLAGSTCPRATRTPGAIRCCEPPAGHLRGG